nr:hypothetical protein [uncultured Porphyromonas sp.]
MISLKGGDSSHYHISYNLVNKERKAGVDLTEEYIKLLSKIEETVSGIPRIYVDKTIKILENDSELFNSLVRKGVGKNAPQDLFPFSERDVRLLLTDAEVSEDGAEDSGAGDLAVRTFTERTDGQAKGEQGVLRLASERKGVRT